MEDIFITSLQEFEWYILSFKAQGIKNLEIYCSSEQYKNLFQLYEQAYPNFNFIKSDIFKVMFYGVYIKVIHKPELDHTKKYHLTLSW